MNKCICHTDTTGHSYMNNNAEINVNFMAIKKPVKIIKNSDGVVLNFYGVCTFGTYESMQNYYNNLSRAL